jgi:aryl-alcohol dehydrogenase-like predicted oxidoreductase
LAGLFPIAAEHGVAIVVRSVLFRGVLTDKGRPLRPELQAIEAHRHVYRELLSPEAPTLSELAMRFALSHPGISSVLIGLGREKHLDRALETADGVYLDAATMARAAELAFPDPGFFELGKWYADGWFV